MPDCRPLAARAAGGAFRSAPCPAPGSVSRPAARPASRPARGLAAALAVVALLGSGGRVALAQSDADPAGATARVFVDAGRTVAVDPARGADPAVDYAALVRSGPWDDRNYALLAADVALLPPDDAQAREAVPAFYRVGMRRAIPDLPRTGPSQYPRSALPAFRLAFGGYLVDGKTYRKARHQDGRFAIVLEGGVDATAHAGANAGVRAGAGAADSGSDAAVESDAGAGVDALSGEVRVTNPNGAAESAIKANPVNPQQVVAGTNGPGSDQKMHWSADGGSTWTQVTLPLGGTCCDPAVDWSSNGQYAYATTLGACGFSGCQVWFYRSADGGRTWTSLSSVTPNDPRRELSSANADKEYLHVDKAAASPYKDRIYVTWHRGNVMQFAVSSDFGNTFTSQGFSSASTKLGIGSDITSNRQGVVHYVWPAYNSRTIRLRRSTDGGATFGSSIVVASTQASYDFPIPSMETRRAFVYASADADLSSGPYGGSVYVAWTDATGPTSDVAASNHAVIRVASSRNGSTGWTVTTPHETADQNTVDRWHPWLAVGPDGKVHVVYYDTRRDATRRGVDLFYSSSSDGAQSWSAPQRVTTVLSPNIADSFEYGDYNGLDAVLSQLVAIFTDNRRESGGSGDSVDVYAAGIPAGGAVCGNGTVEPGEACDGANTSGATCLSLGCTGGGTLGCAADCGALDTAACLACPGTVAGRVGDSLAVARQGADLVLTWAAACGSVQDYAVYEGVAGVAGTDAPKLCTTGGAVTATIGPAAGARSYLVVATNRGVEGSYGATSTGGERPASATACLPQAVGACP